MNFEPGTILYYHPLLGSEALFAGRKTRYTYWVVISERGTSVNVYEVLTGQTVWASHNFLRNNFLKVHTYVSESKRSCNV